MSKGLFMFSMLISIVLVGLGIVAYKVNAPVIYYGKTYRQDIPQKVVDFYTNSVFRVTVNGNTYGTAFYMKPGLLLSACHVVEDLPLPVESIQVVNYNNSISFEADSFTCIENNKVDLAEIKYSSIKLDTLEPPLIIGRLPYIGKTIFKGGYGTGCCLSLDVGYIQPSMIKAGRTINISTDLMPGDSGGPIISYYAEELYIVGVSVGVKAMRVHNGFRSISIPIPHLSMMVPSVDIPNYYEDIENKSEELD